MTMRRNVFYLILLFLGFLLSLTFITEKQAESNARVSYEVKIPLGIPRDIWEIFVPPDNPITPEKVELGRKLYFDKRLSVDNTVSCATCHDPKFAFTDGKKVSEGVKGQKGARNAPTVLNAMFYEEQFWDGRAKTLEEQAKQPIINPIEMGMPDHDAVVKKLKGIPEYVDAFKKVFGGEITIDRIAQAIAAFERTLLTGNSPFDRFIAGDQNAISESAKRGWQLFQGKARCITCHEFNRSNPFFTDNKYHNIGVAMNQEGFAELARKAELLVKEGKLDQRKLDELALNPAYSELGRFLVTFNPKDIGAFKTPTLRNVELTAPYMHDGSEATLLDVIEFYNRGGNENPNLSGEMRPLNLTDQEKQDLVEFLKSLTGEFPKDFPENK
ncbi:cytochrome c peroxidase [Candidatus Thermokryptus mobilis]|uniref:Cytochrome c peroxidase n=2 Tax=Candidatus Thermokryptus mobilis TaxID=1643428 RepID=A0A0S4MP61_9BACT|nr:cytochrome c peroxidase [Candidatus Thermokryptus mobilis]